MATKEHNATYNKYYNTTYPLKRMWHNVKGRAKQNGWDFDISYDEFVSLAEKSTHCPIFGYKLEYIAYTGTGRNITNPFRASLDRKDSSQGYTKDNVWFISWEANAMKNEYTTDKLEQLVLGLRKAGI